MIPSLEFRQTGANALKGGLGGVACAGCAGAGEEGLDLSKLVAKIEFARHSRPRHGIPTGAKRPPPSTGVNSGVMVKDRTPYADHDDPRSPRSDHGRGQIAGRPRSARFGLASSAKWG
jgi:hypothetical protein